MDIYAFVKQQKEAKKETQDALEREVLSGKTLIPKPDDGASNGNITARLYGTNIEKEEDKITNNYCGLCNKPTRVTIDGWPCRVCGQTYHKQCVANCRRYSELDIKMYNRATTPIGWSCEHCDNILNLLESHEIDRLAGAFELLDKNKDSSVSLDEYLTYKKREWDRDEKTPMPPEEEHYNRLQFKTLDADSSGEVDYWEFAKNEGCKCLARRSKKDLVTMLTPYEKSSAKRVYDMLDKDGNGVLTVGEARVTLRGWYHLVAQAADNRGVNKDKETPGTTDLVIEGDENDDMVLTWQEFLRSQALYILSSRPNKVNMK